MADSRLWKWGRGSREQGAERHTPAEDMLVDLHKQVGLHEQQQQQTDAGWLKTGQVTAHDRPRAAVWQRPIITKDQKSQR